MAQQVTTILRDNLDPASDYNNMHADGPQNEQVPIRNRSRSREREPAYGRQRSRAPDRRRVSCSSVPPQTLPCPTAQCATMYSSHCEADSENGHSDATIMAKVYSMNQARRRIKEMRHARSETILLL
jgi:hypothetical protein